LFAQRACPVEAGNQTIEIARLFGQRKGAFRLAVCLTGDLAHRDPLARLERG
jgi:hypothetical protein